MRPYYEDESVTLWHGDCREVTAWLDADVLVTDPPYGIHQSTRRGMNDVAIAGEIRTGRASDRVLGPEHVAVRDAALALWGRKPALVFGHWRAPMPSVTRMRLVWDKQEIGMGGVAAWRPSDEEIYIVGDWPNPKDQGGSKGSVIRCKILRGDLRPDHPTPKPVSLMEQLLMDCPPGVVADPFMGSGTTLLAARYAGRRAVGIEIDERYCEIAARRLDQGVLNFGGAT